MNGNPLDTTLLVAQIQRFCMHDGPGIRTTVFLKGCPLRCAWCHNPETQLGENELLYDAVRCTRCGRAILPSRLATQQSCQGGVIEGHLRMDCTCGESLEVDLSDVCHWAAREMTCTDILKEVLKDQSYYKNGGGITLSGGEPLYHGARAVALLRAAKERGLHTALETCSVFSSSLIADLVETVDLFLLDYKDTPPDRHQRYMGLSNEHIISTIREIDSRGGKSILRCILVQTVNDDDVHLQGIADVFLSLTHCDGVELLPYHALGKAKAERIGRNCLLDDTSWTPTPERMSECAAWLRQKHVTVIAR